jgi:hypothetical protein
VQELTRHTGLPRQGSDDPLYQAALAVEREFVAPSRKRRR